MQVSQTFYRLDQLNRNPEEAHFVNKAYPGAPLSYRATWHPGLFTRDLWVQVFVNPSRSNTLTSSIATIPLQLVTITFILEMPGQVIQHNGTRVNDQTISWTLNPGVPQTLSATARVVNIPLLVALTFTLGSGGLSLAAVLAGRHRRRPGPPASTHHLAKPSSRPTSSSHSPQRV